MNENKTSNAPSSTTSESKSSSSSNTTPPNSELETAKVLRSLVPTKGFRTLSRAQRADVLSQLRLRNQEAKQPQSKLNLFRGSNSTGESVSLRTRLTMLWVRWGSLPKAIYLWAMNKISRRLLKLRNRPVVFIQYPHPILSRVADPIDFEKTTFEERSAIVRKMGIALATASYGDKLGVAAPQVGISKRVCVVQGMVLFNPEWKPSQAPYNEITEGCYSVPDRLFSVKRAQYGYARWQSIDGVWRERKLTKMTAIIFQHELDHLDGKCCADVGQELDAKTGRALQK